MNPKPLICQKVQITGRVQGVGYRYWMLQTAEKFAVTGWVRNTRQGTVEAVVCGNPVNVNGLLNACQQGPRFASVSSVSVIGDVNEHYEHFETRPTV